MPFVDGVNGDELYFEVKGEGPNILLGYPFAASTGGDAPVDLREIFVRPLCERYRVITVDYPRGTGNSAGPNRELMTAEVVSAEMLAVATAADAERFAWWGSVPRMTYAGSADHLIQGGVRLPIAAFFRDQAGELDSLGWTTRLLGGGLDHDGALTSAGYVLPVVADFLGSALAERS
jgi:hypothetical protein